MHTCINTSSHHQSPVHTRTYALVQHRHSFQNRIESNNTTYLPKTHNLGDQPFYFRFIAARSLRPTYRRKYMLGGWTTYFTSSHNFETLDNEAAAPQQSSTQRIAATHTDNNDFSCTGTTCFGHNKAKSSTTWTGCAALSGLFHTPERKSARPHATERHRAAP